MSKGNQFVLKIDTDNADFEGRDTDALQAIFRQVIRKLAYGTDSGKVMDRNGNSVGEFTWNRGKSHD